MTAPAQVDLFAPMRTRSFPPPREFQERAHRDLRAGVQAGHQRQVLMAPTGAGKTYLGLRICDEALLRGGRVLFICDRKTLINQTSVVASGYGMQRHGIFQASNSRMDPELPFQIASAQTIGRRGISDEFRVIVVDEAHTLYKPVTELIANTSATVIGLSATPFTKGLGKIYSRVVNAATMDALVKNGVLTSMRVLSCVRPDMEGAKTTGGEWTAQAAEERGMGLVGDVVKEWLEHAENRKTIVFGPTINHCEALRRQFESAGVGAALFTAETTDAERKELLADYRQADSKIRVLISVEALAKGFDVPDVGCVCDCRPLRKSLSTFVQMVGRGLRSSPGKTECLLLDFSGNIIRFADDFADLYFNGLAELDAGEKLDKEVRKDEEHEPKSCPACGYTPVGKRCVRCGFETQRPSLIEHAAGKASEFDPLGLVKRGWAKDLGQLFAMIATHEKDRAARRVDNGRPPGKPSGSTAYRFKELTGRFPPSEFNFETAPHVRPSVALRMKLRSLEIAFAKSRRLPESP